MTHVHPDTSLDEFLPDPRLVPDWPARQAAAAIPFEVVDGVPANPTPPPPGGRPSSGKGGLWHWGERQAADALVTVSWSGHYWVLMVRRGDGRGWAFPGGFLERGEYPAAGARRECLEETGLGLTGVAYRVHEARPVPDPRATDEAWPVTWPVRFWFGYVEQPPVVTGADDAAEARWVLADTPRDPASFLRAAYGGEVFRAHKGLLTLLDSERDAPVWDGEDV
jgi:ADP-ribose pyrophosphatase YjhB (NUDIX family)